MNNLLLAQAEAVLAKAMALVGAPRSYSLDVAAMLRLRIEIADMIERMVRE